MANSGRRLAVGRAGRFRHRLADLVQEVGREVRVVLPDYRVQVFIDPESFEVGEVLKRLEYRTREVRTKVNETQVPSSNVRNKRYAPA